ncbi:MAG: phosphatidate cytidylyltransferase [Bacteroidales bacterium]|nr:phosphatidate cytidylyltransferase [Bacteroidales bacterium]MDD3208666.1 phosphatidate cytidylyltransferase [Bacteroidales bacterium]MDD3697229.1 phosphatidate cytidylyltransferase [Bacteroidales bacterium]MDD4167753.1 phosphatidate cytidylyltransferase [Bacteroidales bacterium]MDD4472963.1 phosphatidate cytidylyltransferase [Bacteroidales bacterium]
MNTLIKRSISGLVFIVVMIAGLLLHPLGYAVLMTACVGIMVIEFYRMALADWNKKGQVFGFLSAILLFLASYVIARHGVWTARYWLLTLPLPVTAAWISVLFNRSEDAFRSAAFLFLPLVYIAVPFSVINFLVFNSLGMFQGMYLLTLFIILWASDIGGYLIGMGFGQKKGHRLFPRISPKKSWEGFAGSIIFATGAGLALFKLDMLPFTWYHCVVISLIISVFGVLGDLTESAMKRYFGVKDSGNIMPGHGGLLDRFDGALIALPMAVVYILFIVITF